MNRGRGGKLFSGETQSKVSAATQTPTPVLGHVQRGEAGPTPTPVLDMGGELTCHGDRGLDASSRRRSRRLPNQTP